ncbi:hypothetical protein EXU34_16435 [Alteromonas sp. ZYF713]|nr:hypothetical protein [Alteromonas sp. ZYF713]
MRVRRRISQQTDQMFFKHFHDFMRVVAHNYAVVIWDKQRFLGQDEFIDVLESQFQIELVLRNTSYKWQYGVKSNVIYTPLSHSMESLARKRLQSLPVDVFHEAQRKAYSIFNSVIGYPKKQFVEDKLGDLFKVVWDDCPIYISRDKHKPNNVAFRQVMVLMLTTLSHLLDVPKKETELTGLRVGGQYLPGWISVSAAQDYARLATMPVCFRKQMELTELIASNPTELDNWADENRTLTNSVIKHVHQIDPMSCRLENYLMEVEDNERGGFELVVLYKADKNGFALKYNMIQDQKYADLKSKLEKGFTLVAGTTLKSKDSATVKGMEERDKLTNFRVLSVNKQQKALRVRASATSIDLFTG